MKKTAISLVSITILLIQALQAQPSEEWISLFNGKNLGGWDIKIAGHELNDNYNETFSFLEG